MKWNGKNREYSRTVNWEDPGYFDSETAVNFLENDDHGMNQKYGSLEIVYDMGTDMRYVNMSDNRNFFQKKLSGLSESDIVSGYVVF